MHFKADCFKNVSISFVWWIGFTSAACTTLFLVNTGVSVPFEIYAKVVKLISYIWIGFHIFLSMVKLDPASNTALFESKVALDVVVVTGIVSFWFIIDMVYFCCTGVKLEAGPLSTIFGDALISLLPVGLIACANYDLLMYGKCELKAQRRMFLYVADLPCIYAALVLFALCMLLMSVDPLKTNEEVAAVTSGAMAFLVFMTYCVDKALQHVDLPNGALN